MEEIKTPKKPILYYALIVLTIMLILNFFLLPKLTQPSYEEVSYGKFLEMVESGEISEVQIDGDVIYFKDGGDPAKYYRTGLMDDPELVNRLESAGITEYYSTIVEQTSPLVTFPGEVRRGGAARRSGSAGRAWGWGPGMRCRTRCRGLRR